MTNFIDDVQHNRILNILNKGHISENNYDSTKVPFFLQNKNKEFVSDFQEIEGLPNTLNKNIIHIYNIIGNPKCEVYLNDWTLMSYEKALKMYNYYKEDNINNVFDIAFKYMGMGHIDVLSCDLNTHLLFYRPDGGASGIEREDNYNKLKNKNIADYKQFNFSEWFFSIY